MLRRIGLDDLTVSSARVTILVSLLALAGCVEDAGFTQPPASGSLSDGFRPNEALRTRPAIGSLPAANQRSGTDAATGLSYFYGTDRLAEIDSHDTGLGILAPAKPGWIVGCSVDRMTDARQCRINPALSGVAVLDISVSSAGSVSRICVLGHDFPGEVARIRVDTHPLVSTGTSGCTSGGGASVIASEMMAGTVVQVEYVEWPYETRRSRLLSLAGGFPLARELFRFSQSAPPTLFVPEIGQ